MLYINIVKDGKIMACNDLLQACEVAAKDKYVLCWPTAVWGGNFAFEEIGSFTEILAHINYEKMMDIYIHPATKELWKHIKAIPNESNLPYVLYSGRAKINKEALFAIQISNLLNLSHEKMAGQ